MEFGHLLFSLLSKAFCRLTLSNFPKILTVCAILAVVAFICIYFWLPETAGRNFVGVNSSSQRNAEKKSVKSYPNVGFTALPNIGKEDSFCIVGDEDDEDDDEGCFEAEGRMEGGAAEKADSKSASMNGTIINENISESQICQTKSKVSNHAMLPVVDDFDGVNKSKEAIKKPQTFNELLASNSIRSMGVLYTSLCFSVMFVDESFPLWAVTSIQKRGLSWNSGQVGAVLASVGKIVMYEIA